MERIAQLLKKLKELQLEGFFTSSVSNITYLTGFTGDSSRLLVTPQRCVLITDGRYTEQAGLECYKGVEVFKWVENKRYASETYAMLIRETQLKSIGYEGTLLTCSEFDTLKKGLDDVCFKSCDGLVETIRQQKDPQEIENLKTACEISDKALELTLPYIKEGITELELAARLEFALKTNGAENLSFDTLVLSGARTSLLHGKPGTKKLEKGDLVLFDFGALYKGYHADISRTFVLGEASPQQKEVYHLIQRAQMEAILSLKGGVSAQDPDKAVRKVIPENYIDNYYPGLGHGVGLQIHEQPFLNQTTEGQLKENMVVTIEPGIYIPGWGGIRIEDTVLIQSDYALCLSRFPRDLKVL